MNVGLPPFYHLKADTHGIMLIFYLGSLVAVLDHEGKFIARQASVPLYLLEYLIQEPNHSEAKWN